MAQGGAMAVEDAVSIATLLPRDTTMEDIPERLRLYELARRSRVEKVLECTRINGRDENDLTGPRMSCKYRSTVPDSSLPTNDAQKVADDDQLPKWFSSRTCALCITR